MSIPSGYEIIVSKAEGINWNFEPRYHWFCHIDAGEEIEHAQAVSEAVQAAFPAPVYRVALHQKYAHTKSVSQFDWRI